MNAGRISAIGRKPLCSACTNFGGEDDLFVAANEQGEIAVFHTQTGKVLGRFHSRDQRTIAMQVLPPDSESFICVGCFRGTIIFLQRKPNPSDTVHSLSISLAKTFRTVHTSDIKTIAASRTCLAMGDSSGRVSIWDPHAGRLVGMLTGEVPHPVSALLFSLAKDSPLILVVGDSGDTCIINAKRMAPAGEISEILFGQAAVMGSRGTQILTVDSGRVARRIGWNEKGLRCERLWNIKGTTEGETQGAIAAAVINDMGESVVVFSGGEVLLFSETVYCYDVLTRR